MTGDPFPGALDRGSAQAYDELTDQAAAAQLRLDSIQRDRAAAQRALFAAMRKDGEA